MLEDLGRMGDQALAGMSKGLVHMEAGELSRARVVLRQAEMVLHEMDRPVDATYACLTLALLDLQAGDQASGKRWIKRALETLEPFDHGVMLGMVHCIDAMACAVAGESGAAQSAFGAAQPLLSECPWTEAQALLAVAGAFLKAAAPASAPGVGAPVPRQASRHSRARVAMAVLEAWRSDGETGQAPMTTTERFRPDALIVESDGLWFRPPSGSRVDLSRKRILRPLVRLLAERRISDPGSVVDVDGVFTTVWPGEQIMASARKNRVYVAIATLRKSGLNEMLNTRDGGYLLSPDIPVVWAED